MKKVALLVVGLVLCSVPLFAGEYLMNDTGETVYGLRVEFSDLVMITGFGDVFTTVEPAGESTEFVFSGGELGSWDGHWFNWEPASAIIVTYRWHTTHPTSEIPDEDDVQPSFEHAIGNLQYVNVIWYWDWFLDGLSEEYIISKFQEVEDAGWGGVSLDYWMFIKTLESTDVFKLFEETRKYVLRTPMAFELERILRIIRENTELGIEVRIQISYKNENGRNARMGLTPSNPRLLFDDFFDEMKPVIELCNEYDVTIFTPMVELDSLEQYTSEIHRLLDRLDPLFDGWFSISQSTHNYIKEGVFYQQVGDFWGWIDSNGRPLIIGPNCIDLRLASTTTASKEAMQSAMVSMWEGPLQYLREHFPGHYVWFGEMTASRNEGSSLGLDGFDESRRTAPLALDEMQRVYYALLRGAQELGMDGYSILYYSFYPPFWNGEEETWHYIILDEAKPFIESLLQ